MDLLIFQELITQLQISDMELEASENAEIDLLMKQSGVEILDDVLAAENDTSRDFEYALELQSGPDW